MNRFIYASRSHTHCWYEVSMLKVPAKYTITIVIERLREVSALTGLTRNSGAVRGVLVEESRLLHISEECRTSCYYNSGAPVHT